MVDPDKPKKFSPRIIYIFFYAYSDPQIRSHKFSMSINYKAVVLHLPFLFNYQGSPIIHIKVRIPSESEQVNSRILHDRICESLYIFIPRSRDALSPSFINLPSTRLIAISETPSVNNNNNK